MRHTILFALSLQEQYETIFSMLFFRGIQITHSHLSSLTGILFSFLVLLFKFYSPHKCRWKLDHVNLIGLKYTPTIIIMKTSFQHQIFSSRFSLKFIKVFATIVFLNPVLLKIVMQLRVNNYWWRRDKSLMLSNNAMWGQDIDSNQSGNCFDHLVCSCRRYHWLNVH